MEFKCLKCKLPSKIDVFDNIQAIRFICESGNHYGLLSINNFFENFLFNYEDSFNNFITESFNNYEKNGADNKKIITYKSIH